MPAGGCAPFRAPAAEGGDAVVVVLLKESRGCSYVGRSEAVSGLERVGGYRSFGNSNRATWGNQVDRSTGPFQFIRDHALVNLPKHPISGRLSHHNGDAVEFVMRNGIATWELRPGHNIKGI